MGNLLKKMATLPIGEWNQIFGWLRGVGLLQASQPIWPPDAANSLSDLGNRCPKANAQTSKSAFAAGFPSES